MSNKKLTKTVKSILRANDHMIFQPSRGTSGEPTDLLINEKATCISSALEMCDRMGLKLPDLSIVDIGCSRCDMLLALRELGCQNLSGLNLMPFNLEWLKDPATRDEYWGDDQGKVRYLVCNVDSERLPLESSSQSIILYV